MSLTVGALDIRSFRNIHRAVLHPSTGFNLLVGQNAQGKTSTLEAIYLVSVGRLLRGSKDAEGIQEGQESSQVLASLEPAGTTLGMELQVGKRKKALLNGLPQPKASALIGRLPSVCFCAGDLEIVSGEPSARRLFMDTELCQLHPAYLRWLTVYKRALDHRNALLKYAQDHAVEDGRFEVWEAQMSESGEHLRSHRSKWVQEIAATAQPSHAHMGSGEKLDVSYTVKDNWPELLSAWQNERRLDIARGTTSTGPHRDDLTIEVGAKSARLFGSQGQQRTAVISIKLAVLETAKATLGFPPVLLLDDIFSDLDARRRERLTEVALGFGGQVFVTCTEAEQAGSKLVERCKTFLVKSGEITEQ